MYYLIYKITNTINGKEYIGAHQTSDKNDSYVGSGKYLKRAIQKYGLDKFTKEILFEFDNKQDMFAKEAELVNEEYLSEANTYNLRIGGNGGFYNVPEEIEEKRLAGLAQYNVELRNLRMDEEYNTAHLAKCKDTAIRGQQTRNNRILNDIEYRNKLVEQAKYAGLTANSQQSKEKRKQTFKEIGHQKGPKNSQFGSKWIHNPTTLENKKISKDDTIPEGWIKGRKIK